MTTSPETMTIDQLQVGDVVVLVEGDAPFEVVAISPAAGAVRQVDVVPVGGDTSVLRLTVPLSHPVARLGSVALSVG